MIGRMPMASNRFLSQSEGFGNGNARNGRAGIPGTGIGIFHCHPHRAAFGVPLNPETCGSCMTVRGPSPAASFPEII
ncbi:MAG: hypothetical protein MZV63_06280 [Marinilabiliales bacterium]|nr:hypothetical protein [Marinilabiliales bacterium]